MLDSSRFPRRHDTAIALVFSMPFVKLDTGILDSSLWCESAPTCKCWVTLLAMADSTGLVRSTAPGIAKRAYLTIKQTQKALTVFESPDQHSRSLNNEGRKIKRVDGGYQIINYEKYRKFDHTAAERMKAYRERVTRNGRNETVTLRKQKQSTEADKKEEGANGSRQTVEDLIKDLSESQAYVGIDVRREYAKAANWCKHNKKTLTVRRFVNWLNRAERPLPLLHASRPDYKRNYPPPAREPTEAELKHAREIAKRETDKLRQQLGG